MSNIDMVLAGEIVNIVTNDGKFYDYHVKPVLANLARKIKKGSYDSTLALKLWAYKADEAVKLYSTTQMGYKKATLTIANKETRKAIASLLAAYYGEQLAEEAGVDHVLV